MRRLAILTVFLAGCGATDGGAPTQSFAATLEYLRVHGLPSLADLLPSLPGQLSRVSGVETDESGLPTVPDAFSGATFGDSTAAINGVLGDAKQLSAQGFSEARRIETMVHNLATPIYELLGRSDLFAAIGGAAAGTEAGTDGAALFMMQEAGGGGTIFDDLADVLSYAIDVGGQDGMPAFVVLSGNAATASIDISGLWPDAGNFATGFHASLRLNALDDMDVSLTMAPGLVKGLIPTWGSQSCADDLWNVAIKATPDAGKSLTVKSNECPGTRNALSAMTLGAGADGMWQLSGGFAQSYEGADPDSLRGWLGARQGFVVQTAISSDLDRLAAAAAVLGESDFAAPTQDAIDQFGVGQLIARYFQATYFDPRRKEAKNAGTFDLDKYENVAYWTCYASGISSSIKDEVPATKDLCAGKSIDVESTLGALVSLNDAIKGADLVPSDVKKTVKGLVDILSIRNTLFVGGDASIAYKKAPDAAFTALDDGRKGILPAALSDASWKDGASSLLQPVLTAELPDTPYKALAKGLSNFLSKQCAALAGDTAAKAGKTATSACSF
jgi:hypothetical protein